MQHLWRNVSLCNDAGRTQANALHGTKQILKLTRVCHNCVKGYFFLLTLLRINSAYIWSIHWGFSLFEFINAYVKTVIFSLIYVCWRLIASKCMFYTFKIVIITMYYMKIMYLEWFLVLQSSILYSLAVNEKYRPEWKKYDID